MPDFRATKSNAKGTLLSEALVRLNCKISNAIGGEPKEDDAEDAEISLKDRYVANVDNLHALDHMLRVSYHDQALQLAKMSRIPEALKRGYSRFLVPMEELPQELQDLAFGRKFRSCIEDPSGATWLETAMTPEDVSIFVHCDRGSVGFPAKVMLFDRVGGCRGDAIPDIAHRRNNAYLRAWHMSGCGGVKVELGLLLKLLRQPFKGCGN